MDERIEIKEKYERNGAPSLPRPDLKTPVGWHLSLLAADDRLHHHSLSPDGRQVVFIWNRGETSDLYQVDASGGFPRRLTTARSARQWWWDGRPRFSPDGRWLVFTQGGHVQVMPAGGGALKKLTDFTHGASSPVWMPDSRRLIVSVERHDETHLVMTDLEGALPQQLTFGAGDDSDAQPAPDGSLVAYVFRPLADLDCLELRVVPPGTAAMRVLVSEPEHRVSRPRWSPQGDRIAFLFNRTGFNELWLVAPDGGGLRQLTSAGCDLADPAWSPDGRWLAVTINRAGALDLALVDAQTGALIDLRASLGCHINPQWAPDGAFLTCEYTSPVLAPEIYRAAVNLTAPGAIADDRIRRLTYASLPVFDKTALVMPQRVMVESADGLQVPAFLFKPALSNKAAIVHPHGGPRDQYVLDWDLDYQYLVAKGYTVLAINYRGGTGYGREFERLNQNAWGIGDTQDCLAGARFLAGLEWVDRQRIGIMGGSYGGYMTVASLVADDERLFACGVCYYGDADIPVSWALCERDTRLYTEMQLGHPAQQRQVYRAGSPIHQIEKIQSPLLILHGLDDDIVPPQASETIVEALRKAGKTYEYKTYAGESHGFLKRETILDAGARVHRFLDWHLFPEVT
ncbi:MAG: S9 family peptidase [Anaerolineae bacterium]|nr:S9 family peptidase [Anaerolineae bacterium]